MQQQEEFNDLQLNDDASPTKTKVSTRNIDQNEASQIANDEVKRNDLRESLDIQDDQENKGAGDLMSSSRSRVSHTEPINTSSISDIKQKQTTPSRKTTPPIETHTTNPDKTLDQKTTGFQQDSQPDRTNSSSKKVPPQEASTGDAHGEVKQIDHSALPESEVQNKAKSLNNKSNPTTINSSKQLPNSNRQVENHASADTTVDIEKSDQIDKQMTSRSQENEKQCAPSKLSNSRAPNSDRSIKNGDIKTASDKQSIPNSNGEHEKNGGNRTDRSLKKQPSQAKGDLTNPNNQKILMESLKDHAAMSQKYANDYYSPRFSPGGDEGDSPDIPIIKDRDLDGVQVKTFFVHRNGDLFDSAKKVVYNRRYYRTFEIFLRELTTQLDYPNAIRKLHTPNNFSQVNSFDEIRSGTTYVALSKTEKLQKFDYHVAGQPLNFIFKKKQNYANNGDFPQPPKIKSKPKPLVEGRLKRELDEKKSKTILIYRNGDEFTRAIIILLKPIEQQSLDMVIRAVEERVILANNKPIHRLYDLNGTLVRDPDELEDAHFYVAAANETFLQRPYGQIQLPQVFTTKAKPTKIKYLNHPATPSNSYKPNSVPANLNIENESPVDRARTRTLNATEILMEYPEYNEKPATPPPVIKSILYDHTSRKDEYDAIQRSISERRSHRGKSHSLSPHRLTIPHLLGDASHNAEYNEEELIILSERDPKKEKDRLMDELEFKVVMDNYYKNFQPSKTPRYEFPLNPSAKVVPHVQVVGRFVRASTPSPEKQSEEEPDVKKKKKIEHRSISRNKNEKKKKMPKDEKDDSTLKSSLKRGRSKSKSRVNFDEESKKRKRSRSKSIDRSQSTERQSRDRTKKRPLKNEKRGKSSSKDRAKGKAASRSTSRNKNNRKGSSSRERKSSKDKGKGKDKGSKSTERGRKRSRSKEKKSPRSKSEQPNDKKQNNFKPFLINRRNGKKGPRSVSLQTDKILMQIYYANNPKELQMPKKKKTGRLNPKLTEKVIHIQQKVREQTPPEKLKISDPRLHENLDIFGRATNKETFKARQSKSESLPRINNIKEKSNSNKPQPNKSTNDPKATNNQAQPLQTNDSKGKTTSKPMPSKQNENSQSKTTANKQQVKTTADSQTLPNKGNVKQQQRNTNKDTKPIPPANKQNPPPVKNAQAPPTKKSPELKSQQTKMADNNSSKADQTKSNGKPSNSNLKTQNNTVKSTTQPSKKG